MTFVLQIDSPPVIYNSGVIFTNSTFTISPSTGNDGSVLKGEMITGAGHDPSRLQV